MARLWFALSIGLGGLAILISLGVWQLQRLAWKEGILAEIDARIAAAPVPLPAQPDPESDKYLPVFASGQFENRPIRILASIKQVGAVHRIIAPFVTENGRRVLVDLGWKAVATPTEALPTGATPVTGNLHWPQEIDSYTPEPDRTANLWFARDVPGLADALQTEETLIVLRDMPQIDLPTTPMPVDTAAIPNDHLQYAITWFSLAAVWAGMTLLFTLRSRAKQKES